MAVEASVNRWSRFGVPSAPPPATRVAATLVIHMPRHGVQRGEEPIHVQRLSNPDPPLVEDPSPRHPRPIDPGDQIGPHACEAVRGEGRARGHRDRDRDGDRVNPAKFDRDVVPLRVRDLDGDVARGWRPDRPRIRNGESDVGVRPAVHDHENCAGLDDDILDRHVSVGMVVAHQRVGHPRLPQNPRADRLKAVASVCGDLALVAPPVFGVRLSVPSERRRSRVRDGRPAGDRGNQEVEFPDAGDDGPERHRAAEHVNRSPGGDGRIRVGGEHRAGCRTHAAVRGHDGSSRAAQGCRHR